MPSIRQNDELYSKPEETLSLSNSYDTIMAIKLLETCSTCEVHKLSFFTLETFQVVLLTVVVLHPFNGSSIYFMFNILYVTYV